MYSLLPAVTLATATEPSELTEACKITLPIAVIEVCSAIGSPMPSRRRTYGARSLKLSRVMRSTS